MKVVVDTNVLVSGLLNPYGPPGRIVQMAAAGELTLCFDVRILGEYRDVLLRPVFSFRAEHVEALLEQIRAGGEPVMPRPLKHHLPDRDDEPFMEAAIAAAECLITGNLRHYPAKSRGTVQVVLPAEFLEICRK
jgi:uncharacterized protein